LFSAKEEGGKYFIYFVMGISKFENFKGLLPTDSKKEKYTYRYEEKRKDARSQSKHNLICVQTSYMFRLSTATIRLNM